MPTAWQASRAQTTLPALTTTAPCPMRGVPYAARRVHARIPSHTQGGRPEKLGCISTGRGSYSQGSEGSLRKIRCEPSRHMVLASKHLVARARRAEGIRFV